MVARSYAACAEHLTAAVFHLTESQNKTDVVARIWLKEGKDPLHKCACGELAWYYLGEYPEAYVDDAGTLRMRD